MPEFSFPLGPDLYEPGTSPFDIIFDNIHQRLPDNFQGKGDYLRKDEFENVFFNSYTRLQSGTRNGRRFVIFQITETIDTEETTITCAIHDRHDNQEYQVIAYDVKSCPLITSPIFWGGADGYQNTTEMSNLCNILRGESVTVGPFTYELLH